MNLRSFSEPADQKLRRISTYSGSDHSLDHGRYHHELSFHCCSRKSDRGASLFLRSQQARCQLPYTEPGDQFRSSSFRLKTYTSLTSDFAKDRLATEGVGPNALAWQQLSMAHSRCCNAHYTTSAEAVD